MLLKVFSVYLIRLHGNVIFAKQLKFVIDSTSTDTQTRIITLLLKIILIIHLPISFVNIYNAILFSLYIRIGRSFRFVFAVRFFVRIIFRFVANNHHNWYITLSTVVDVMSSIRYYSALAELPFIFHGILH